MTRLCIVAYGAPMLYGYLIVAFERELEGRDNIEVVVDRRRPAPAPGSGAPGVERRTHTAVEEALQTRGYVLLDEAGNVAPLEDVPAPRDAAARLRAAAEWVRDRAQSTWRMGPATATVVKLAGAIAGLGVAALLVALQLPDLPEPASALRAAQPRIAAAPAPTISESSPRLAVRPPAPLVTPSAPNAPSAALVARTPAPAAVESAPARPASRSPAPAAAESPAAAKAPAPAAAASRTPASAAAERPAVVKVPAPWVPAASRTAAPAAVESTPAAKASAPGASTSRTAAPAAVESAPAAKASAPPASRPSAAPKTNPTSGPSSSARAEAPPAKAPVATRVSAAAPANGERPAPAAAAPIAAGQLRIQFDGNAHGVGGERSITYTARLSDARGRPLTKADVSLHGWMPDGTDLKARLASTSTPGIYRGSVEVGARTPSKLRLKIAHGGKRFDVAPGQRLP